MNRPSFVEGKSTTEECGAQTLSMRYREKVGGRRRFTRKRSQTLYAGLVRKIELMFERRCSEQNILRPLKLILSADLDIGALVQREFQELKSPRLCNVKQRKLLVPT